MFTPPLIRSGRDSRPLKQAGFTLLEVAVAMGVISIFVAGAVLALVQMNRFATVSRLHTLALGLAQQRVDEIHTTQWILGTPRPAALTAEMRTDANLPLNNDSFNSRVGLASLFSDLDTQVNATRVSQITDISARQLRAVVTVSYTFRGRNYSLIMNTLRASDSI